MLTSEEVEEFFEKKTQPDRWVFSPDWNSPLKGYRYGLTFIASERRFTLSRQKIEPFTTVDDEQLLSAFRSQLSEEEVAACMRAAMRRDPDDDIPF